MYTLIRYSDTSYQVYHHDTNNRTGTYSLNQVINNFCKLTMARNTSNLEDTITFVCNLNSRRNYQPVTFTAERLDDFYHLYPELFI